MKFKEKIKKIEKKLVIYKIKLFLKKQYIDFKY